MKLFADLLLISIVTIIALRSLKLISKYKTNSLADFAILLLYVFQTVPIMFDVTLGLPKYAPWYSGFSEAMVNDTVCIIYDFYVIAINIGLYFVSKRSQRVARCIFASNINELGNTVSDLVLLLFILSPVIHAIISGNATKLLVYGSFKERGLASSYTVLNSFLVIVSTVALMVWYFKREATIFRLIVFLLFALMIVWVSGKRYSVITIVYSYIYLYVMEHKTSRKRMNMKLALFVCVLAVIIYSVYYITSVKVISDGSFDSTYAALRIDFGRDDVVKFTIWKEYIYGEHILDYPLQSVISTILMIVPRKIIPWKGYPHYRYLTAALYNTDILSIPAGMTPSVLEMMIANFYVLGMPVCVLFLCWYCQQADKASTGFQRYCYSMLMMGMLSQSLDSMIGLFYIVLFFMATNKVKFVV